MQRAVPLAGLATVHLQKGEPNVHTAPLRHRGDGAAAVRVATGTDRLRRFRTGLEPWRQPPHRAGARPDERLSTM